MRTKWSASASAVYQYFLSWYGGKICKELCQLLVVLNDGAATLGTESTNSIRKLNGWLSFGAGQPLSADQAVTVASGTGPKTLPLNAKLNLKGYHHALPTNRNFNETITWNLTTQPTPRATE